LTFFPNGAKILDNANNLLVLIYDLNLN
jgi:hypothetical protein